MQVWLWKNGLDLWLSRSSGGELEDLTIIVLAAVAMPIAMFFADIFGLVTGLGWRHYSKKRKMAKKLAQSLNQHD